jgi:hypothetical protein
VTIIIGIICKDGILIGSDSRFIRMRHGTPLATAAAEYAKQTKNMELAKLVSEFSYGQANEMPKAEMEVLWSKICNLIPSKPELVEMGVEYFKMFGNYPLDIRLFLA